MDLSYPSSFATPRNYVKEAEEQDKRNQIKRVANKTYQKYTGYRSRNRRAAANAAATAEETKQFWQRKPNGTWQSTERLINSMDRAKKNAALVANNRASSWVKNNGKWKPVKNGNLTPVGGKRSTRKAKKSTRKTRKH